MKKVFMLISLVAVLLLKAAAQEISLEKGWKFTTGDNENGPYQNSMIRIGSLLILYIAGNSRARRIMMVLAGTGCMW